jgi:hypothetical protein
MGCYGQDWAGYQSAVMPTDGLAYAFAKATEGTGYTNPKHAAQVAYSRAQKLVVGHYHFVRPGTTMKAQADYFLKQAAPRAGDPIALDWEDPGVSGAEKDAWIQYVQGRMPHLQVGLYCNRDFWLNRDRTNFAGNFLWIADPDMAAGKPRVKAKWVFHQYSEAKGVDHDFCSLSAGELRVWVHAREAAPPPPVHSPVPPAPKGTAVFTNAQATSMYDDLMKVRRKDNGEVHAVGYFEATILDEVLKLQAAVAALAAEVKALKAS